ncbi:alpha-hydroxy acid oxidase [Streptomyces sp. MMS24-I29]|uniref:alpha-hydroxy acid oxidase n=1 Tax=Streptomyces sp. MMS24-I29 TaxID=3351480 RepID=UPI003C7E09A4
MPALSVPVDDAVSVDEVRQLAQLVMRPEVSDFIGGGAGHEVTLDANRAAFDRLWVTPQVLTDSSGRSPATTLLGGEASFPAAAAPMAYQALVHPDGEIAAARAAKEAGIPFTTGTLSSEPLEAVAAAAGDLWFQLYWLRDRRATFDLIRCAEDAGCKALMFTVDVPWMGRRLRDVRNAFTLPATVTAANLAGGAASAPDAPSRAHRRTADRGSAVAAHTEIAFEPALTWRNLEELRSATTLPLVIKGVLAPSDAARSAACGADAIVVSNHGGRQLDGAVPSIEALPGVRSAVGDRVQVLLDSGVRRGTDVLKALALGADGVLIGRPLLWGLALGGQQGVQKVLDLLAAEFRDALGLAGCSRPADVRHLHVATAASARDRGPW